MQDKLPHARPRTALESGLLDEVVATLGPRPGITIGEDASLSEAIRTMQHKLIGCLLITNEQGHLTGILSERDVLDKCVGQELDLGAIQVREHMTSYPETVRSNQPIAFALQRMVVTGFRHLPVVDADGTLLGVISARDIIKRVASQLPGTL